MAAFSYHNFDSVISIDFGTTYSGTCYTFTRNLKEDEAKKTLKDVNIIHVTNWPEQKGTKLLKIPTVCLYNSRTNKLFKWGADAVKYWNDSNKSNDNLKLIEKFKLKLQTTRTKGKQIILENDDGSLHVKATNDFLKAIYEYTFKEMENAAIEKGVIDKSKIRFVLTVPAQWTDDDRKLLRLICIEAGLISEKDHDSRMHIINESFASTIYCERDLAEKANIMFGKGKRYLICDAGGGTVDLATYESTGPDEELHNLSNGRCQLTFDRGQNCGSVFVDERMRDLLLEIVFVDKKERETYKDMFSSILKSFIENIKPNFNYTDEDEEDFKNGDIDSQTIFFNLTQVDTRHFSRSSKSQSKYFGPLEFETDTFSIPDAIKEGLDLEHLAIPKKVIKEMVFDKVVEDTLKLVKKQIARSNYDITTTFLLGGFGKSPYLQSRLKEKAQEFGTGIIVTDNEGEAAAMRGALYYGIDFIRRDELSDIYGTKFEDENDVDFNSKEHEVLISLDVGYEHSSASYTLLNNNKEEKNTINIEKWPGDHNRDNIYWPNHRKADKFKVPTAIFEPSEVENLAAGASEDFKWGYEALASDSHGNLIVPSSNLALFRDDFKDFLVKYLKQFHEYVVQYVSKETSIAKQKYRYCLTMENSFKFFESKRDMREIAISAEIINSTDSPKKLLLINREDACAVYHENIHFGIKTDYYKNNFLQLFIARDHVRMTVHESTAIATLEQKLEERKKDRDPFSFLNEDDRTGQLFRNVRTADSITFPFNFIERLVYNFDLFITSNETEEKTRDNEAKPGRPKHETFKCLQHNTRGECFDYTEENIRKGFLAYIQEYIDFDDNSKIQTIYINKERGCYIQMPVHDIIEFVFKVTYKELAFNLRRYFTERNINSKFRIDNIFLLGTAVESSQEEANEFMLDILAMEISKIVSSAEDRLELVKLDRDNEGKEVLQGLSFYGLNPEKHTQKISRKTYAVHVIAFQPEKRNHKTDEPLKPGEELKRDDIEFFKTNDPVTLEVQRYTNRTTIETVEHDDLIIIMDKDTPTSCFDEINGINRRFFSKEECLVYATIYVTEIEKEKITSYKIDNDQFRKIHQFEVEVRKSDKLNHIDGESRLDFSIRLYVDSNDTKFKADSANDVLVVPEYRYRDEFKVTNIY